MWTLMFKTSEQLLDKSPIVNSNVHTMSTGRMGIPNSPLGADPRKPLKPLQGCSQKHASHFALYALLICHFWGFTDGTKH